MVAAPPPIRHAMDRTPERESLALSVTDTGETSQPFRPSVASGTAVETGAVPSTVNVPARVSGAFPHASAARSDHV